jgi:FkbH-like protein
MYREDRQRRAFQAGTPSYEEFLKELNVQVSIQKLQPALLDRAVQLCQRTNQFNLTTRRYTAEQLQRFSESPDAIVLMMSLVDRFGEYGWSGLAVATAKNEKLTIDAFLVSCRVLGKNVELGLFSALARWAAARSCTEIGGAYIPSGKNKPCADFYEKCGMVLHNDLEAGSEQRFAARMTELPDLPLGHLEMSMNF